MEKRLSLQRKGSKVDAFFNYAGLTVSILYVFVIIAIILTLIVGSWSSIQRFSFSFLFGTQWNVRSAIALSPLINIENSTITLRFSVPIKNQSLDTLSFIELETKESLSFTGVDVKDKNIILSVPLKDGIYELSIPETIKNTTGYPLLHSYTYIFGIENAVIVSPEWIKHDTELSSNAENTVFGALPFLLGTVLTSVLAILFSVPFAIAIAIYLNEYEKKTRKAYILSSIADLLAGIPSVIYGFWGMFFLVPYFGSNIFTASLVLAIMSLPYSTAMTREAIALVPNALRYAGFAMGATQYSVLLHIVIPYAKSGIVAGVILALGRALGETLAVTMVIGNSNRMPFSIFEPAQTIASLIANEYAEASGMKQSALIELGLLLICVTIFFGLLGRFFIRGRRNV